MLLLYIVIVLQIVSLTWCRSLPPLTNQPQMATMNPRQLWDRLNTVDGDREDQKSVEYSRIEPVSRDFGTSPSSLYLIEAYREIRDSETTDTITAFSASVFEDINQIQLTRPMYQHIYRLVLSRAALREHYSPHTEATLWIPLYNHELVRQLNKSEGESIRVCLGHKERRKHQYCYTMDTTGLELTPHNGHTWIGLGIGDLARREVENRSNKKNLYLYFSLNGCHTDNGRCNSVSYLGAQYLRVLDLSNPRVPFLILRSPSPS